MKIVFGNLFKNITAVKKMVGKAAQDISDVQKFSTDTDKGKATVDLAGDYENVLLDIQKAYIDGDKELLMRNSTNASIPFIESLPFPPNPTIFVQKHEKVDTTNGPIVIARVVLKEPGKYYKRNMVLVWINGSWKYDIRASEEHPIAQE